MIISFPSTMYAFQVLLDASKDATVFLSYRGADPMLFVFTSPISLKRRDLIYVDIRTGKVEAIERCGVSIWRWSLCN